MDDDDMRRKIRELYYGEEVSKNRRRMIILAVIAIVIVSGYLVLPYALQFVNSLGNEIKTEAEAAQKAAEMNETLRNASAMMEELRGMV